MRLLRSGLPCFGDVVERVELIGSFDVRSDGSKGGVSPRFLVKMPSSVHPSNPIVAFPVGCHVVAVIDFEWPYG